MVPRSRVAVSGLTTLSQGKASVEVIADVAVAVVAEDEVGIVDEVGIAEGVEAVEVAVEVLLEEHRGLEGLLPLRAGRSHSELSPISCWIFMT
jgi:hypothetical protein